MGGITDWVSVQKLKSRLYPLVTSLGIRRLARRTLVDRLVDLAEWYSVGIYDPQKKTPGRPPKTSLQVMLIDCAKALGKARGTEESIWQRDIGEPGSPESDAVKLARAVIKIAGHPLDSSLRRQTQRSRGIKS